VKALVAVLPDQLLIFLVIAAAFALIVGARKTAGGLLAIVLFAALAGPFIEAAIGALPLWALLLLAVWLAVAAFRWLSELFLGRQAGPHFVAIVAAKAIESVFALPVRLLRLAFMLLRR
jgi:hypothetical protein